MIIENPNNLSLPRLRAIWEVDKLPNLQLSSAACQNYINKIKCIPVDVYEQDWKKLVSDLEQIIEKYRRFKPYMQDDYLLKQAKTKQYA